MKKAIILILLILLSSCKKEDYLSIEIGMSVHQIRKLIGSPDDIKIYIMYEKGYMIYIYNRFPLYIYFINGKVVSKSQERIH